MAMKKTLMLLISMTILFLIARPYVACGQEMKDTVKLPDPIRKGEVSVEEALQQRRSVRKYADRSLTLQEISQLLWAAQGITDSQGLRSAPSAGALYPLDVYIVTGEVEELTAGIYKYHPFEHELILLSEGDKRHALCGAALEQECIRDALAVIVLTAVYERSMKKYGERGIRYSHIEIGCAAQNVYLQAESLNLGTVFIGAFHDDEVKKVLNLNKDERPLAIMPVGRIK